MRNQTATHFIEVYSDKEYTHQTRPKPIHDLKMEISATKLINGIHTVCVFLITPKNKENELKSDATKGA